MCGMCHKEEFINLLKTMNDEDLQKRAYSLDIEYDENESRESIIEKIIDSQSMQTVR